MSFGLTPQSHILLTVFCTVISAAFWGNVPYFPIEISRNAASGIVPLTVFRLGFFSLIFTLIRTNTLTWTAYMLWISLVFIAAFDDFNYVMLHSVGVAGLIVSSACNVYFYKWNSGVIPFCAALAIYGMRGLMKLFTLILMEGVQVTSVEQFVKTFGLKHSAIMYYGAKNCINSEATIPVFQFAGVLQWAVLYGFATCF